MAQVQGSGAGQGVKKKKKLPVGPDRRIAPPARTITKHIYKGVSFYSSDGRTLGPQQKQSVIKAAQKIPDKVWNRLAMADAKVFVMKNNEKVMAPVALEYFKALGIPKADAIYSYIGNKDMAYTDAGRNPVAVIGIGKLPPYPNGMPRETPPGNEGQGHVILHETAHTLDMSFQVMKAIGAVYSGLERKTLQSAAKAHEVTQQYRSQPMDVTEPGRMDVSARKDFRSTIPKDYTAGYGDPTKQYDKTVKYPRAEVFAESLARYWNKEMIPPKMQGFFDNYFSTDW